METFKGYKVVEEYPKDGWLKGYFYVREGDSTSKEKVLGKAYRDLSYIKHKDFALHLLDIKTGDKVLDVGCANGAMMVYCGLLGAEVFGVDLSVNSVETANNYLGRFGLKGKASVGDVRKMEFPDNFFDKIISSDFFEHLVRSDNIQALAEMRRVLKPGGKLVLRTPNLRYLRLAKIFKQITRLVTFKNPFIVVIPHTEGKAHQHVGLTTRKEMVGVIGAAGFLNVRFYYPLNSKIEKVNYALGEFLSGSSFFRDMFTEDIVALVYKPIITSYFQ